MSEVEELVAELRATGTPSNNINLLLHRAAKALEALTTEWEYGAVLYYLDGWERGHRLDDERYVIYTVKDYRGPGDRVRRRKAGPWEAFDDH